MKRKSIPLLEKGLMFGSTVRQTNWTLYSRAEDEVEELLYIIPVCLVAIVLKFNTMATRQT